MNVGQLRKLLEQADDSDLVVVCSRNSHIYSNVYLEYITVLQDKNGVLSEDHGEKLTPQSEYGNRIHAIQIVNLT